MRPIIGVLLLSLLFGCSKSKNKESIEEENNLGQVSFSLAADASKFSQYRLMFESIDLIDASGNKYPLLSEALSIDVTSPRMPLEISNLPVPQGDYKQVSFRIKSAASLFSIYREEEEKASLVEEKIMPVQLDGQPFESGSVQEFVVDYAFTVNTDETLYLLAFHDIVKSLSVSKNDDLTKELTVQFSPYFQLESFSSYEEASILAKESIYHPSNESHAKSSVLSGQIVAIDFDRLSIKTDKGILGVPLEGMLIQSAEDTEQVLLPQTLHLYQKVLYFSDANILSVIPTKFLVKIDGEDYSPGVAQWRIHAINDSYTNTFKGNEWIKVDATAVLADAEKFLSVNNSFALFTGFVQTGVDGFFIKANAFEHVPLNQLSLSINAEESGVLQWVYQQGDGEIVLGLSETSLDNISARLLLSDIEQSVYFDIKGLSIRKESQINFRYLTELGMHSETIHYDQMEKALLGKFNAKKDILRLFAKGRFDPVTELLIVDRLALDWGDSSSSQELLFEESIEGSAEKKGLSKGAIAGIVVPSVLVGVPVVGYLVAKAWIRFKGLKYIDKFFVDVIGLTDLQINATQKVLSLPELIKIARDTDEAQISEWIKEKSAQLPEKIGKGLAKNADQGAKLFKQAIDKLQPTYIDIIDAQIKLLTVSAAERADQFSITDQLRKSGLLRVVLRHRSSIEKVLTGLMMLNAFGSKSDIDGTSKSSGLVGAITPDMLGHSFKDYKKASKAIVDVIQIGSDVIDEGITLRAIKNTISSHRYLSKLRSRAEATVAARRVKTK